MGWAMKYFVSGAVCAVAISVFGVSGTPAAAQEASTELTLAEYEALINQAKSHQNPVEYDRAVSAILERSDLTGFQRGRTLFERATRRWKDGMDKFGGVSDFEALLAMDPNHPFAANARIELDWAKTEIGYIEKEMSGLQTLAEWFDGAFALGLRDEAVARYRKAGISPTPEQVQLMKDFGYLCKDLPGAPKLHQFGPEREDLANVHWCGAAASMPGPDVAPARQPAPQAGLQQASAEVVENGSGEAESEPVIAAAGP